MTQCQNRISLAMGRILDLLVKTSLERVYLYHFEYLKEHSHPFWTKRFQFKRSLPSGIPLPPGGGLKCGLMWIFFPCGGPGKNIQAFSF